MVFILSTVGKEFRIYAFVIFANISFGIQISNNNTLLSVVAPVGGQRSHIKVEYLDLVSICVDSHLESMLSDHFPGMRQLNGEANLLEDGSSVVAEFCRFGHFVDIDEWNLDTQGCLARRGHILFSREC